MTWEKDEELQSPPSNFYKFAEGLNKITLASDGEKVRGKYGAAVEFKTRDDKILSLKPGAILDVVREAKEKHETLVGRILIVTRTGLTRDDTRYTDIKVE